MSKAIKYASFEVVAVECASSAISSEERAIAMRAFVAQWSDEEGFPPFQKLDKTLKSEWKVACAAAFDNKAAGVKLARAAKTTACAVAIGDLRAMKKGLSESQADAVQALSDGVNNFASNAWRDQIVTPDNRAMGRSRKNGKGGAEVTDWRESLAKTPLNKVVEKMAALISDGFEIPRDIQKTLADAVLALSIK